MKLSVGQILFVVLKKENRVYPLQVVEEVSKKSMEGETVSYVVQGGSDPNTKMNIADIDGEVFDSAAKAKQVLTARATTAISMLVDNAVQKSKEWYPSGFEQSESDPLQPLKKKKGTGATPPPAKIELDDDNTIELADGTRARVRSVSVPDVLK